MDNINGLMADCGLRQRKRGMGESSGETVLNKVHEKTQGGSLIAWLAGNS